MTSPPSPHHSVPRQQTDQHVQFSDSSWSIWRWTALRGTGFPVNQALRLASPACQTAAEECLHAEATVRQTKQATIAQLKDARGDDADQRKIITNIIHQLHADKSPATTNVPDHLREALATVAQAQQQRAEAHARFAATFTEATLISAQALQAVVATEPFQRALVWQNRKIVASSVQHFLRHPLTETDRDYLRNRSVLVKYLHRYTMKNDTIGFFGPVGWCRWDGQAAETQYDPGADVIARRTTYLEGWGINAIAQAIAADPAVLPWATPRLMPQIHLTPGLLHIPFAKPLPLSPAQSAVLMACTGDVTAQTIAQRLVPQRIPGLATPAEVYAMLAQMQKFRRITWSFDVTLENPFPAPALQRQLERIELAAPRMAAMAKLDAYLQAAQRVQAASTDAPQLNQAIEALETTFTTLTGATAVRSTGQMYAGRTLVYEDCQRGGKLTLGAPALQTLERPMALLLTSARWLTFHLTQAARAFLRAAHTELAQKNGTTSVEFAEFFPWVNSRLFAPDSTLFDDVRSQFQQRWAAILALSGNERHPRFAAADIAPAIYATFDAPGPGCATARYYSPDLMIDAVDVAAINRGDFRFVLGELHLTMNTLGSLIFTQQHPQISDLYAATEQDQPEPQILQLTSSHLVPATRSYQSLVLPKDIRLITSTDVCDAPTSHTLRMGDLVVTSNGAALHVQSRDGKFAFDALDVLGDFLSLVIADDFVITPPSAHSPRITIDQLVVTREAWRIPITEMGRLVAKTTAESYLNLYRWAQLNGMPQYLFYRTPKERKPGFLDLASPLGVELFMRELRRLINTEVPGDALLSFSEMLPDPHHAWLADAQGNHYTSELRIAVVDQKDRQA
ncbi:MAG: lantibiotic dehydratase [Ktedonobacterales bacterium]|nr:lantibiotic dehydratase [Ktedonobacterales bacterium]